jgi:ankyrin repeat protein
MENESNDSLDLISTSKKTKIEESEISEDKDELFISTIINMAKKLDTIKLIETFKIPTDESNSNIELTRKYEKIDNYVATRLNNDFKHLDKDRNSILHNAIKTKNMDVIKYILHIYSKSKRWLEMKNNDGETALGMVLNENPINMPIVKILMEFGCSPYCVIDYSKKLRSPTISFMHNNPVINIGKRHVLHIDNVIRNQTCLEYFVNEMKLDVDVKFEWNGTYIYSWDIALFKFLEKAFAFIISKCKTSTYEETQGIIQNIQYLPIIKNKPWAFKYIFDLNHNKEFPNIKNTKKNDENIIEEYDMDVYEFCISRGEEGLFFIEELLKRKYQVNKYSSNGYAPIHNCIKYKNIEALKLFLKFKDDDDLNLDIDILTKDTGYTALYMAVQLKYYVMTELLLEAGADPDIDPDILNYPSMLHIATINENAETITLLLENGANPCRADENGFIPFEYACKLKNTKIKKLYKDIFTEKGINMADIKFNIDKKTKWTSIILKNNPNEKSQDQPIIIEDITQKSSESKNQESQPQNNNIIAEK